MNTQNNGAASNGAVSAVVERRYVHLEGRAIVRPFTDPESGEAVLQVTFVDGEFKPLVGTNPLFVYADETEGLRLMCHHLHMIASFTEGGYIRNKATLQVVDPMVEGWDKLERSEGLGGMTPTGPPPR
ncbi:hypothetical protein [Fibrella aquatilis]|uniref:Uncharacterized protein n=1 Tax=Fibrella aquatilis TaxID=2817059 RepID=A0A939K034_9BACT|nr:hypothetical protein [Fibrella aquatilis]MBO0930820.1 hypothetical protein [Fibrella aquatilis]